MRITLHQLDIVSRVFLLGAIFLSLTAAITFRECLILQQHQDAYRPAMFVVARAHYEKHPDGTADYWLEGRVDSQEERLTPDLDRRQRPNSEADLLARYPIGQRIEVLHRPDLGDSLSASTKLPRIIPGGPDFWPRESRRRLNSALMTFLPVPIAAGFFLAVRRARRRQRQSGG
jgi:hypothetical protein